MIKHEEVRKELNYLYGYFGEDIPRQYILEQYITEQEKKDELLELYRKLHDTYRYPTWKNEKDVQCILKQIKALEEEMK